jgi:ribose transport system substrate-binding protein
MQALEENPGVELVAYESGDWDRTKAYNLISNMLVAHPDVDGVWAANDNMCMGSIEALRAAGLAGDVLVTGYDGNEDVARAIVAGEAAATVGVDPRWQGGEGLALALAAHRGELDVASLPAEKRQWWADQIYVDADNAQWYIDNYVEGTAEYDYTELWDRWLRGME